jgi:hypothetical protein
MPQPLNPEERLASLLEGLSPEDRAVANAIGQQVIAKRKGQDQTQASRTGSSTAIQPTEGDSEAELAARTARIQVLRTQEIGQLAEAALVNIVDEGDEEAHAFQRQQMAALRDELAPPGSSIAERLLAEAIVKARFEYMMWSARADYHFLHPAPKPEMFVVHESPVRRAAKDKAHRAYKARAFAEEKARLAEKRYLSTLRDLEALRRQNAPLVQLNIAHQTAPQACADEVQIPAPAPRKRALRQKSPSALIPATKPTSHTSATPTPAPGEPAASSSTWEGTATPHSDAS